MAQVYLVRALEDFGVDKTELNGWGDGRGSTLRVRGYLSTGANLYLRNRRLSNYFLFDYFGDLLCTRIRLD